MPLKDPWYPGLAMSTPSARRRASMMATVSGVRSEVSVS